MASFAFEIIHHLQISLAFAFLALVAGCASGYPKRFALTGSARIPVTLSVLAASLFRWRYQCLSGIGVPNCLYTRLQKSTSISNSPIFLWRASRSLSKSSQWRSRTSSPNHPPDAAEPLRGQHLL